VDQNGPAPCVPQIAKIYTQEKITVAIPPPIIYNYKCIDYVACTVIGKREGTGDRRHYNSIFGLWGDPPLNTLICHSPQQYP